MKSGALRGVACLDLDLLHDDVPSGTLSGWSAQRPALMVDESGDPQNFDLSKSASGREQCVQGLVRVFLHYM